MNTLKVRMVRVYLTSTKKNTDKIIQHLKTELTIRGVTLFRAIEGYGSSGEHNATMMDILMELPLVLEFFDEEIKVNQALEYLTLLVTPKHIVYWDALVNA